MQSIFEFVALTLVFSLMLWIVYCAGWHRGRADGIRWSMNKIYPPAPPNSEDAG